MRIINIMQDIRPVNMGILSAAINTAIILRNVFNVQSEIWFYGSHHNNTFNAVEAVALKSRRIKYLKQLVKERNLDPSTDIIVTHGPWNYQSFWGNYLAKKKFKWVFMPHGVLEPCGMKQKWLKKKIYYTLFEKKMLLNASAIRAISSPEKKNLEKLFPGREIILIPNGFDIQTGATAAITKKNTSFLYLARLHPLKGATRLAEAWVASSLNNNSAYSLNIAGPDEGELAKIKILLTQSNNANYLGTVYNREKNELIAAATFFVLPSLCEGFSISLLETAYAGLIPVITEGCNFPELVQKQLAVITGATPKEIQLSLEYCAGLNLQQVNALSKGVSNYIKSNYSLEIIAQKQYDLYAGLLSKQY
ncbi:MAG TPA: glycosyltransferase [Panacibacter sp.]|nr:glycosyltransferase [Panacibacter sp.]